MSQDERFLMLDVEGGLIELHGDLLNIGSLLGKTISMYEGLPGMCFALSHTTSVRYAEPNLHLSKFARTISGVIAPFFGSAIIFGGLVMSGDDQHLIALDPDYEQALRASVAASRAWLTQHPEQARRGAELANGLRELSSRQQAPRR